ncbi:MAG: CBS domain-containing protein, partial [Psychrobacter nivimaris]
MPHLDFSQPPFDVLSLAERQSIKKNTQIRYLAKNESLPAEELQFLYVVIKGQIEQSLNGEFVASYVGSNHADGLNNNDWFDSRRLPESLTKDNQLEPESTPIQPYQFRANEETLLLQVAGTAIDKISAQNHLVRQMLSDKLPERLKALRQRRHNKTLDPASYTNQQEVQQIMLQPVIDVHLLPVHIVDANDSLYEAASIMTKAGLKHVLVRSLHSLEGLNEVNSLNGSDSSQTAQHETGLLLGILTDTDICRAVSDRQDLAITPCQRYANFNLRTIKATDEIGDALLTMTRYRIHRLPVIDKSGDVVGVLGQSDMLAHIGHHSQLISIQIEQAQDLSSLDTAVELIGRYIRAQHHNGVKIGNISRMVQTLNAQVFTKLWQLIVPDEVMA